MRVAPWLVAVGFVLHASASHAESPSHLALLTSVGVGEARMGDSFDEYASSFALQADVGYRLTSTETTAIGAHVGLGSSSSLSVVNGASMYDEGWDYSYRPLELGVSLQLAVRDSVTLSPWIGMQNGIKQQECHWFNDKRVPGGMYTKDCTAGGWDLDASASLAGGLSFAVDAWSFADGSRVSVVGSAMVAKGNDVYDEGEVQPYRAVWLGVGYRFWAR